MKPFDKNSRMGYPFAQTFAQKKQNFFIRLRKRLRNRLQ